MDSNLLRVCSERDDDRPAAAIARIYTDDAIWTSDEAVTVGHGAPKSTNGRENAVFSRPFVDLGVLRELY